MLIWLSLTGCTFVTDEEWAARLVGCELAGQYVDDDGDGWGVSAVKTCDQLATSVNRTGDCNDTEPAAYPGATEVLYDGLDADCLGDSDWDKDGDGFDAIAGGGGDCYDSEDEDLPTFEDDCDVARGTFFPEDIHPDAFDEPYDGVDADCSGETDFDADGDGFRKCDECDDADPERYPNVEVEIWYNGYDEDCDGNDGDQDGDGYVVENYAYEPTLEQLRGDCWDAPADRPAEFVAGNGFVDPAAQNVHPAGIEVWYDLVDSNCSRDDDLDQDADGGLVQDYANREGTFGDDCNDQNPAINALATENWYDGTDADCRGDNDYDRDADGDNSELHGGSDCDEGDPTVSIYGTEDCASAGDDNCDGAANEENAENCTLLFSDNDADGYGAGASRCLCTPEDSYSSPVETDCNDGDAAVNPAAAETCATEVDDDCDGDSVELNHAECIDWFIDADGDGFGGAESVCACLPTSFYTVSVGEDCDEASAATFPGSVETCMDGRDGGCDDSPTPCTVSGDGPLASQPFRFEGAAGEAMGSSVGWLGDTDGDGLDEAFLSAPDSGGGVVYVIGDVTDGGFADELAFAMLLGEATGDAFGTAVAGLGDIDGDGFGDVLVGAPASQSTGEAYLFYGPVLDGSLPIHAAARFAGEAALDAAGQSVALLGDPDGDGVGGLVVGAPGNAYNGSGAGLVTLIDGAAAWGPLALSTVMDAGVYGEFSDDAFGSAIAASGDANGDGLIDLLIGAPGSDPGSTNSGAAYLFLAPNIGLQSATSADLTVFGGADGREIGRSLAMGDLDGDGTSEILMGSPFDDTMATDAGAAWGMSGAVVGVQFIDSGTFVVYGSTADERLGASLAAGDITQEGTNDLLIGAPGYAALVGAVHVFTTMPAGATDSNAASARYLGETAGDLAGQSMGWLGNADADGLGDFIVGAPGGAATAGLAYRVRSGGF